MPKIHPTAIIDPAAELADDVLVGAYSVIGPHVRIGPATAIGAHCIIENHTSLGAHNRIGHHVVLGAEPQDLKYRGEPSTLLIGDHNDIRENVTAHIGTENGGGSTSIGSHNLIMVAAHIAHDCHVRDHCILANNVMLAGHIEVQDHAVLSGGSAITHYTTVGRYAFLGGMSAVVHDCPPFMISDGNHARVRSINSVGLIRNHFAPQTIDRLKAAYLALFGHRARRSGSVWEALDQLQERFGSDECVMELLSFVRRAAEAPHGRAAEAARRDDKRLSPAR